MRGGTPMKEDRRGRKKMQKKRSEEDGR